LRAGNDEAAIRQRARGLEQEALKRRLAVGAVGAEVGEVPLLRHVERRIGFGIHRAIKRACGGGAEMLLEVAKRRAAGEGEIDIVAGDDVGREIFVVAAVEFGEGDGRVDVVEGGDAAGVALHEAADFDPIRHVGADDHRVCILDLGKPLLKPGEVGVIFEAAVIGVLVVAAGGVPGHVPLQEQDVVAAGGECFQERAEGGGVAVAPA
jgi:hypothetical protein